MIFPEDRRESFSFQFDKEDFSLLLPERGTASAPAAWTTLASNQCEHCPFRDQTTAPTHCPLALSLEPVVDSTKHLFSYEEVDVVVTLPNRRIEAHTTVQKALSSLMGLLIPTSGCPKTAYFKPMARFHLPFSDQHETIYRSTSMYLLAQFFQQSQGQSVQLGLEGLNDIYDNMRLINGGIASRLQEIQAKDSSLNAIVLLDLFTMILPMSIETSLDGLKGLFHTYFEEC